MKMKSDKFNWDIIANMGWGAAVLSGERRPYERMKRTFMETYSEDIARQFNEWYRDKRNVLVAEYDVAETQSGKRYGNFGGDDSFGDMMDHVMGLGEEYYNAVMSNFKLLNKLEPQENFSYGIPYTSVNMNDYDSMKPKKHKKLARKALKAIAKTATECKVSNDDMVIIGDTMNRLALMIAGKFEEAVGDLDFKKDYNRFYEYEGNEHSALYANVLFDCKKYMI